jgi:phospholipid-binding lipoprotein MlaA
MKISFLIIFTALLIPSCATKRATPAREIQAAAATDALDDYEGVAEVSDPIEPLNRATFVFNDRLYSWVFTPISKTYTTLLPSPLRQCIGNVYENIKFPVRFVNSSLQGNFKRAGQELQKFGVNTVAGFGGLINQSDRIPSLKDVPLEDSGQTLATWGIGHGPYIVLPVLGPCTARETLGLVSDYALNPVNWTFALGENADRWAWIPSAGNTLRSLPDQLSKYNDSKANAIDPYTAVKSTYIQNRNNAANQ